MVGVLGTTCPAAISAVGTCVDPVTSRNRTHERKGPGRISDPEEISTKELTCSRLAAYLY
jgi:hypothetical protein